MDQASASDGPAARAQAPGFYRFGVGAFTAVALHDGVIVRDRPANFVRNATADEVGDAFAACGMARDKLTLTFNALAVETPRGVVLIDTGLGAGQAGAGQAGAGQAGAGQLAANLAAAGIRPADVTAVVISHFHADHIGGLLGADGTPAFPDAEVLVPEPEWDFWLGGGDGGARLPDALKGAAEAARRTFAPLAARLRRFRYGEELLPGFTAVDAGGHTPGMAAVEVASGGAATLFVADVTNNPLVFARRPDWQALFDVEPDRAVATRRRLLDRAAADRTRLSFFHAPFPATGYVVKAGSGYDYVPALWTAG